jgi:signal transduction histidine kinase
VGLGLYIVRHVVTAHGGTVEVASSSAEGTTLSLRLARSPADRASSSKGQTAVQG